MTASRRDILAAGAVLPLAAATPAPAKAYRKIATEEAFAIPEWFEAMDTIPASSPEVNEVRLLKSLQSVPALRRGLLDFDYRLQGMDETGVDMHLLSLTTPGVQSLDAARGVALAQLANDRLAAVMAKHPTRFAGLAAVAPQDPAAAALEIERAMKTLRFSGVLINSYTHGEFLDHPKFDPILAALAAHNAPLYLHPRVPAPAMVQPYTEHGLLGALWGFAADTGLHAMRLIMSGVFDRYPGLMVVLGHMGEAIPYWFWRIDNMYKRTVGATNAAARGFTHLKKLPSQYFRENFYITTSGVNSHANLKFAIDLLGVDRIMFAIDYPYESSAESVAFLDTAPITTDARDRIAHRNAERVFSIRPG